LCAFFVLKETHGPTLLRKRAKVIARNTTYVQQVAVPSTEKEPRAHAYEYMPHSFGRPLKLLFHSPVVLLCCLLVTILCGTMNMLYSTLGVIYQDRYDF